MGGGSERVSCKALVWSRMYLRGGDVQETSPFEIFAPAKTLGQGPSVVKGKHLRFLSGHSPEASILKKAQLPARRGHRAEAVEQPGQIPHTAVPSSTYGQKQRHSLVSMDRSHIRLFKLGFVYVQGQGIPVAP